MEGWLRQSGSRALVVRRRDAEDLVLTTASRAAQAREGFIGNVPDFHRFDAA